MNNLWDFFVWLFWFYVIISCIWIFITVFIDIFRDPELNGWVKALWVLFLVFVPFLAAFVYLIARGRSMAQRNMERAHLALLDEVASLDQSVQDWAHWDDAYGFVQGDPSPLGIPTGGFALVSTRWDNTDLKQHLKVSWRVDGTPRLMETT